MFSYCSLICWDLWTSKEACDNDSGHWLVISIRWVVECIEEYFPFSLLNRKYSAGIYLLFSYHLAYISLNQWVCSNWMFWTNAECTPENVCEKGWLASTFRSYVVFRLFLQETVLPELLMRVAQKVMPHIFFAQKLFIQNVWNSCTV